MSLCQVGVSEGNGGLDVIAVALFLDHGEYHIDDADLDVAQVNLCLLCPRRPCGVVSAVCNI